ncbi:hypothetical protein C8B47_10800 [filamentous cyanobacterium CCP4]|nr:hypothetical protein C8B47_10800 [filamentous cyanobacterium CCP4]
MAEHPKQMLYRVIGTRLSGNTDAGTNLYTSYVPEKKTRPYLLITVPSLPERNFHFRQQDPSATVQVKAVSSNEAQALTILQQAFELLDDQGEQDKQGLVGGADWHILKAMCGERMSMSYEVGTTKVFEEIFHVRIDLQEKT